MIARLEYLELGKTLVNSSDVLSGFAVIKQLSLKDLNLDNLDGIKQYTYLETINLAGTKVNSLDVLQELPSLKEIYANGELYEKLMEIFADTDVSVIFQQ